LVAKTTAAALPNWSAVWMNPSFQSLPPQSWGGEPGDRDGQAAFGGSMTDESKVACQRLR